MLSFFTKYPINPNWSITRALSNWNKSPEAAAKGQVRGLNGGMDWGRMGGTSSAIIIFYFYVLCNYHFFLYVLVMHVCTVVIKKLETVAILSSSSGTSDYLSLPRCSLLVIRIFLSSKLFPAHFPLPFKIPFALSSWMTSSTGSPHLEWSPSRNYILYLTVVTLCS